MALTTIPSDFGSGGANLNPTGNKPRLKDILSEHKTALENNRESILRSAQGIITETASRLVVLGSTALISGTVYYAAVALVSGDLIQNVTIFVQAAGSGVTLSKLGLYAADGTLLAATSDQGTAWQSTGQKTVALISPYSVVTSGLYYVAFLAVASPTMPSISTESGLSYTPTAIGSGKLPFGTQISQADLPSPGLITGGVTAPAGTAPRVFWAALS